MRRRSLRCHDDGTLIWTPALTGLVGAVGGVLVLPLAIDGAAGASVGTGPADLFYQALAALGVVSLVVAAAGRIRTRWRLGCLRLLSEGTGRYRVCTRRPSALPYFYALILGGGTVAALAVQWSATTSRDHVAVVCGLGVVVIGCYMTGPVSRFVVTPGYLRVDTPFRSRLVPRHLVNGITANGTTVRVGVRRDRPIEFYARPAVQRGTRFPVGEGETAAVAERVRILLRAVPAAPGSGNVIVRVRPGTIAMSILCVAVCIALALVYHR